MTLLAELDRLAQAATPVLTKRYASYDSEKLRAFHDACEPEVILKLLACIDAADAMRATYWNDAADEPAVDTYDAARKRLEE